MDFDYADVYSLLGGDSKDQLAFINIMNSISINSDGSTSNDSSPTLTANESLLLSTTMTSTSTSSTAKHFTKSVAVVVVPIIFCLIGLFGSVFAITTLSRSKRRMKSASYWYTLQLLVANTVFIVTLVFFAPENLYADELLQNNLCIAREAILFFNNFCSMFFLMYICCDQFNKTRKMSSHSVKSYSLMNVLVTTVSWITSVVLCIPMMYKEVSEEWKIAFLSYTTALSAVIAVVIGTLFVLTVHRFNKNVNEKVCEVNVSTIYGHIKSIKKEPERLNLGVIKLTGALIACYICLWLPFYILYLIAAIKNLNTKQLALCQQFPVSALVLAYVNAMVNSFIFLACQNSNKLCGKVDNFLGEKKSSTEGSSLNTDSNSVSI
ncbi:unnamed protein product [Clavelina lepadiformis]|uniref:G-protein coupled receptors family 1 profile domain-containing protein n=1 Tax=Clavelina lepadiformis TaxID=159417 RepID=A0ABP0GKV2_CLALP